MHTQVTAVYNRMRTLFGTISVKHNGKTYLAPALSQDKALTGDGVVLQENAAGAVRLLVAEVEKPYPKTGDDIGIESGLDGDIEKRTVLQADTVSSGVAILIQYGAKYGG